jgi:hypothetical protein
MPPVPAPSTPWWGRLGRCRDAVRPDAAAAVHHPAAGGRRVPVARRLAAVAKNLQPKFSRLSPKQNLSKFFKAKHYGDLLMSVLKAATVAGVVYAYCKANVRHFTALPSMTLDLAVREGMPCFCPA